jgi:phosphoserine phosphatase
MERVILSDLDGTLVKDSLVLTHACWLEQSGAIQTNGAAQAWKQDKKNEAAITRLAIEYQKAIKGMTLKDLKVIEFIGYYLNNHQVYKDALNELRNGSAYIITGSPSYLVSVLVPALCHKYGLQNQPTIYASIYKREAGRFTGLITLPMFSKEEKEKAANEILSRHQDQAHVIGLGDTFSDSPLLACADVRVLVEPNAKTLEEYQHANITIDYIYQD